MLTTLLALTLSSAPKPPAPPPTSPKPITTTEVGRFTVQQGEMSADEIAKLFNKHIKQQADVYRNTGGNFNGPWAYFDTIKQESTWQIMTRNQPEWRFTDSENQTWVYLAPEFGKRSPSKVLQIADRSTAEKYDVTLTTYCTDVETNCAAYHLKAQNSLAPKPLGLSQGIAYQQWLNRVKIERCSSYPVNMSHPRYPPQALRDGIGGVVIVGLLFNRCGNVRDAWIETSSRNRDLDRAALSKALEWQIDLAILPEGAADKRLANVPVRFEPGY